VRGREFYSPSQTITFTKKGVEATHSGSSEINMTLLDDYKVTKPNCESQRWITRPYGYRFEAIDVVKLTDFDDALHLLCKFEHETHETHMIAMGSNFPHVDRVIFEVASHIEGNFGPPYDATLIFSEAHQGTLFIQTPTQSNWWNNERWSELSNYIMGLRAMLDLMRK
jgi:hypothetical protein